MTPNQLAPASVSFTAMSPASDLWYPGATPNPAPANLWGVYRDDDNQWKYVLHTTEADVFRPDNDSYYGHLNYPHFTAGPDAHHDLNVWQHIPINRAARALKNKPGGVETNADRCVQIEIVGRAHNAPNFSNALLDLVQAVGLWVVAQTGMPWTCGVRFVAGGVGVRMAGAAFDNYAGICGHQHVPENDHVDPGAINVAYLLDVGPPAPPIGDDDVPLRIVQCRDHPAAGEFLTDGLTSVRTLTAEALTHGRNLGYYPQTTDQVPHDWLAWVDQAQDGHHNPASV